MRSLEIIHLRCPGPRLTLLLAAVREALAGLADPDRVEIHRHVGVPGDVAIHLRHDTERDRTDLAGLGERLAASLREVGMVEHSHWRVEVETSP